MFARVAVASVATWFIACSSERFLHSTDAAVSAWAALADSLACGSGLLEVDFQAIEVVLVPMWNTMPKDGQGQIELRSLRYLADRFFKFSANVRLRGFEGNAPVEGSAWDPVELDRRVPGFTDIALTGGRFTFNNTVTYVAALQQFIWEASFSVLERVMLEKGVAVDGVMRHDAFVSLLFSHLLHWIGRDTFDGECFRASGAQNDLCFEIPHMDELENLVRAQVAGLEFRRQEVGRDTISVWDRTFSRSDAQAIARSIVNEFAWFYDTDCSTMRDALEGMDSTGAGRVPLSRFYGSHNYFGETEGYLDHLGVLDYEKSREPQVIIPNYIQAASNCIVATQEYHVCCPNPCEHLFREIEVGLGVAEATEADILAVVGNVMDATTLGGKPPEVEGLLRSRLAEVAAAHGGKVKIHGRLFSQWMHYVFPRDCPFPHKSGSVSATSLLEFAGVVEADQDERTTQSVATDLGNVSESVWMSQWDEEEELLTGYTQTHAFSLPVPVVLGTLVFVSIRLGLYVRDASKAKSTTGGWTGAKTHCV